MTAQDTRAPYRPVAPPGRDGFGALLRAEWTKFRTLRGQPITIAVAALLIVLIGLLYASGSRSSCSEGTKEVACPVPPVGPGGGPVRDKLYFVHKALTGDGSITARVTSMSGIITYPPPDHDKIVPGLVPWAKAGLIVRRDLRPGSPYAAVLATADHGVRMQHDYTEDVAGRPGPVTPQAPRWLRLTRQGDTLTGHESADGVTWSKVGVARLPGLPATVQAGMFANSPGDLTIKPDVVAGSVSQMRFTETTAVFDRVDVRGQVSPGEWRTADIGVTKGDGPGGLHHPGSLVRSGDTFTITGNGDLAPAGGEGGAPVERSLTGSWIALIAVIVVAVMFVTAEYRRGLIRITLAASPRRGRVLVAKAAVLFTVTFVAALAACAAVVPPARRILESNGNVVAPVDPLTQVRVVAGTALLLAVAAVLAMALGALFRRGAPAVITATALIVVPNLLATASLLPEGLSRWLLRVTPAAGFAIQQSVPEYAQVIAHYAPVAGYYPLAPWAGFAVLCGYAALALALAVARLRRGDA
ncbi:ABC transporter permease subunit [Nonomuraea sp. NN258]|uniref:ABC transporter permease subunit n=1 Tax=Nonomuraea antri TaxID=2730852 RepID=UPI001569C021|nr:ABC transporter permease subunit [Nonomuraea antri]NRQ35513.1 ABC transporter permease subunit [Nonomuraea antri]